jgi:hypothetical protein
VLLPSGYIAWISVGTKDDLSPGFKKRIENMEEGLLGFDFAFKKLQIVNYE